MPNYLPVGGAERVSEPSDLDEAVPVSRFAVGGQADVAQMLRQVNEYNMYGDDPEYASESSGVLGELYGVGQGGPSKVEVKRVKGRELEPKTSKGFGKGMAMSLGPLAVGKEGKVGQGNADLLEVARQYKLKARQAENEARGLMRDTFGAPTLEQPTLLRGPLMRKRFSEGGEVEVRSLTRALSGAPESEELRNEAIQAVKRMDDSAVVATANRLVGKSFSSPTIARLMLEKMVGDTAVSVGVVGQGKALPERLSGYTLGAGVPFFGGYLRGDVDVNRGPGSPMYRLGFQKEFADGGEIVSPEEQPVVEESGASRALKEMMAPVREGIKGYFGMEPGTAGGEAYRAGQALSNMPGVGAPAALVAGTVGLGSRAIPAAKRLLMMPCSDMKCATPEQAKDLYKGVFYQTYRNQVKPGHEPQMMILSAKHGFVTPKQILEPYNQKMTPQQADELVRTVKQSLEAVQWPIGIEEVMLVGGKHYQKVMNAAVDELKAQGKLPDNVIVRSTKGEIGQQRQQLGEYLRGISEGDVPLSKRHGGFIEKSFEEGGDVNKSQSYSNEPDAMDDPIRSGRPLQRRTRRAATQEENEALNRAVLQGVANMPYNLVGAPVDIANMVLTPVGLGSERPVMGSDWIKQKMTDLGIRPDMPTDPTQRALYTAADIGSGLVNPAAPVRAAAKGAEKAGEAARMLAEDFQQYNRALGPAGASYAIKPKGGNWLEGNVEKAVAPLKVRDRYGMESPELLSEALNIPLEEAKKIWNPADVALNQWIDRNLTNYVKKEMGTPEDPLRRLAEQGVVTYPDMVALGRADASPQTVQRRIKSGFPEAGFAQGEEARAWESLTDEMIHRSAAGELARLPSTSAKNPWLKNVPAETPIYGIYDSPGDVLGFDHVVDVLRQELAGGRIRPEQLNKVSIEDAVRRTYDFDQQMAKRMREAQVKVVEGLPVVKQYDQGYKWIELTKPEITELPEGYRAEPYKSQYSEGIKIIGPDGKQAAAGDNLEQALRNWGETRLEDALKYEGNTMGHCVGGYCPDVIEGRSRIYSLRDAKGEPHVTVEVQPEPNPYIRNNGNITEAGLRLIRKKFPESNFDIEYGNWFKKSGQHSMDFAKGYAPWIKENYPEIYEATIGAPAGQVITQIKGKQNKAPKEEYLPFVQDFVKSGNWGEVKDLRNAGLVKVTEGQRLPGFSKTIQPGFYTLDELRQMAIDNDMPKDILDTWMSKLGDQLRRGYAQGGPVDTSTARAQLATLKAA